MKLENQVVSLNQAKKLKELGVAQNSLLSWLDYSENPHGPKIVWSSMMAFEKDPTYVYAAFNVAEMGVMLPKAFGVCNWSFYHRHCWKGESVGYTSFGKQPIEQGWYATEAEARCDMLIRLLENNIITAAEVNERLANS